MADTKASALSAITTPALEDLFYGVDDPGGTPASGQMTGVSVFGEMGGDIPGGRLTLTTGVPVTTADVTAATNVYYTPYLHDKIRIYDGTTWNQYVFTELTLAVPASTTQMYDIWIYDNAGTLTLEALAWTNDTTRATALVRQDGVLCKTGVLTRRYLGSFRTTGVSGQTESSLAKRFVWNYFNRVELRARRLDSTDHEYTTASYRIWNNDAANITEFVIGVIEDSSILTFKGQTNGTAGSACLHGAVLNQTGSAIVSTNNYSGQFMVMGATEIISTSGGGLATGYNYAALTEFGATGSNYYDGAVEVMFKG